VRGYEIGKEEHVVLSASDLESLPLRTAHTIEILQFCARDEVPDLYLDRAYYVEPEEVGRRPYALLNTALERSGRVGIGKVALRGLVEEKQAGTPLERPAPPAAPEKVIDLMEALKASVEQARRRGTG